MQRLTALYAPWRAVGCPGSAQRGVTPMGSCAPARKPGGGARRSPGPTQRGVTPGPWGQKRNNRFTFTTSPRFRSPPA